VSAGNRDTAKVGHGERIPSFKSNVCGEALTQRVPLAAFISSYRRRLAEGKNSVEVEGHGILARIRFIVASTRHRQAMLVLAANLASLSIASLSSTFSIPILRSFSM